MRPYGRHLLICEHGDCADPEAAARLQQRFRELAQSLGLMKLRNPARVKCTLSGCLGVCAGGPIVVVYPDGLWYHHVDEALLERIVHEHLVDGRPVEAHVFHRADFARVYLAWGGYAYTSAEQGTPAEDAFATALSGVQVATKNQDNREHDLFDSDDYLQFHGGMIATIRALTGQNPARYFGDSSDPARPKTRDLREEAGASSARAWSTRNGSPACSATATRAAWNWRQRWTTSSATMPRLRW
jgi:(2Fe-2S) ferredoxin